MENFLFQATIYLSAAVVAVPIAARLGLGSVLGYLLAGIVIGPVLGLVGSETQDLQHFAEFGVVMMLFLIGLELEPRALWDMRDRLIGLGGLQIGLTTAIIMGATMIFLGQTWSVSLAVGLIFALSSTAIVLQTLSEKGLMQTGGGRSIFSVLLTQDIAVIPMLAFLPLLAVSGLAHDTYATGVAHGGDDGTANGIEMALSLVENLPGWGVTLITLGAVAAIVLGGMYLTNPVFRFIHNARLREIYTATALLIVVGIACLMLIVGLSPALGTFLAGVVLANSEFRHELESDIAPFKGLLLGLFFITVGAGIDFSLLSDDLVRIVQLTLALMLAKGVVLFALAVVFKMRGRDRWLFTLGLAQAGEFGFVLIGFSVQQGVIPTGLSQTLSIVVALSMLLTPLFFIVFDILSRRMQKPGEDIPHDDVASEGPIIIAGIGRFGQVVNRTVQAAGFQTTVLDHDLNMIQLMRRFGFKGFFGDPTRPELLHAAGLREARVLVVALDDKEAATRLVEHARRERPDIHIVARARDRVHVYELYRAGADDIVRELFDSSLRAGRYVLENMGLSKYEASEHERTFFKHDRRSLRELAELWRPGIPVADNPEYVERAKQLNNEMETEIFTAIENKRGEKVIQDRS
ncbi:MAG: cation:proton antiporter [Pseudomonadota bacterium]